MRRGISNSVAAALLACLACQTALAEVVTGEEAPDFVLKSSQGVNLRLSEFRGNVVLLNFWAEWCSDCRNQLPELQQLHERYEQAGLVLLGISLDEDIRHAGDTAQEYGATYRVLSDRGGKISRMYEVDKMPVTVLIDRDGRLRGVYRGYRSRDEQAFVAELKNLLKE
jgi:peroxiredoxin